MGGRRGDKYPFVHSSIAVSLLQVLPSTIFQQHEAPKPEPLRRDARACVQIQYSSKPTPDSVLVSFQTPKTHCYDAKSPQAERCGAV